MKSLALVLPGVSFILRGKFTTGIFCLILQSTLIGWIPAALWAYTTFDEDMKEKKIERVLRSLRAFPSHA